MMKLGALLCLVSITFVSRADSLDAQQQQRVRDATFEVVQLKPTNDPLTYEKELPLELIPYQQRMDKYRSIGTAFAIGGNQFVTAAHVLAAGLSTLYGPLMLRDTTGTVYSIDKVLKYSQSQDFVVFSLGNRPSNAQSLAIGDHPPLNDPVFSAGNALGQGIVIRDGVFTSDTPEENQGRWQWLRFTAAASPGNSGGPLVDRYGRVIGVVLRKSESENLNYAVPIQLIVGASIQEAVLDAHNAYRLPIMDTSEIVETHDRVPLPKSLPDFMAALASIKQSTIDHSDAQLLDHNAARLFPQSETSAALLKETTRSPFPRRIRENPDRVWIASTSQTQTLQLEHNGVVQFGNGLFRLRAPDDISLTTLYGDSKLFMDLLLRSGFALHRKIGTDSIKVTSLGKAQDESTYTDKYGRIWQVRIWPIPFNDTYLVAMNLPTPEGYVSLLATGPSSVKNIMVRQQELLANFIYVTFEGSLERWHEYLALKSIQPKAFTTFTLNIDPDKRLQFRSKRCELDVTPEMLALSKDSVLSLDFSFYKDATTVVWDVGGINVGQTARSGNWLDVQRIARPESSLAEGFQSTWTKLATGEFPYNATTSNTNGSTKISVGATAPVNDRDKINVRYTLTVLTEGTLDPQSMRGRLDVLNRNFRALEY